VRRACDSLAAVTRRLRRVLACAILGLPASASGQTPASGAAPPAPDAPDAATVRIVVPERAYLRRRSVHLSDERRTPDDRSKPWFDWEHATGDWGGLRPRLHESGIIPQLTFTGQLFANVRGGLTTSDATHAAGLASFSLSLDSTRLGLWRGGTAQLAVEHQDGTGVSREVGSLADIGTLDGGPAHFTHLAAYTLQQSLLDDRLVARIGKSDANDGFVDSDLAELFLSGSFAPASNVPMPTYPEPAFGVAVFADPTPRLTLAAAAYGADLAVEQSGGAGLFRGRVFAITEMTFHVRPLGLTGHYNAGAWLRSADTPDPRDPPGGRTRPRNYGAYALLEQRLTAPDPARADRGLGAWLQLSWAPPDRNPDPLWIGGGLVYTGLVPGREDDDLGLGVSGTKLVDAPGDPDSPPWEIVLECFYALQIAPWLSLQPDLQIVVNPAGGGRDAIVVGAQLSIDL
jgi:porin